MPCGGLEVHSRWKGTNTGSCMCIMPTPCIAIDSVPNLGTQSVADREDVRLPVGKQLISLARRVHMSPLSRGPVDATISVCLVLGPQPAHLSPCDGRDRPRRSLANLPRDLVLAPPRIDNLPRTTDILSDPREHVAHLALHLARLVPLVAEPAAGGGDSGGKVEEEHEVGRREADVG